tara:strand:+ start:11471 stop:12742 length:1272 start_codon:yes stop_codon:yes gene_type:complete
MKIQSIRGMNDILPDDSSKWQYVEHHLSEMLRSYGYREIRFPILEQSELFKRTIGSVTDIIEKEMYSFYDRNGDNLSLRPEGTAGCVRASIQNGLLHNQSQRLWYIGPMFRHERPQKGRLRQFHQFGAEVFGLAGPDIDAEILIMTARLWSRLGIRSTIKLQINTLGELEERVKYRSELLSFLTDHRDRLDDDNRRRLSSNPMRVLDSKNPSVQSLLSGAPELTDFLGQSSRDHFDQVSSLLDAANIEYQINRRLVRGLDYYSKTVFEWVTDSLGAQGTICGGGRFDRLVQQVGGKACKGIGFSIGLERLLLLLDAKSALPDSVRNDLDLYIVAVGNVTAEASAIAEELRTAYSHLRIERHCGGGTFRAQLKKADKSGARLALILGEDECASGTLGIKYLREKRDQDTIDQNRLIEYMNNIFT